jgi:hypothetical protein
MLKHMMSKSTEPKMRDREPKRVNEVVAKKLVTGKMSSLKKINMMIGIKKKIENSQREDRGLLEVVMGLAMLRKETLVLMMIEMILSKEVVGVEDVEVEVVDNLEVIQTETCLMRGPR